VCVANIITGNIITVILHSHVTVSSITVTTTKCQYSYTGTNTNVLVQCRYLVDQFCGTTNKWIELTLPAKTERKGNRRYKNIHIIIMSIRREERERLEDKVYEAIVALTIAPISRLLDQNNISVIASALRFSDYDNGIMQKLIRFLKARIKHSDPAVSIQAMRVLDRFCAEMGLPFKQTAKPKILPRLIMISNSRRDYSIDLQRWAQRVIFCHWVRRDGDQLVFPRGMKIPPDLSQNLAGFAGPSQVALTDIGATVELVPPTSNLREQSPSSEIYAPPTSLSVILPDNEQRVFHAQSALPSPQQHTLQRQQEQLLMSSQSITD